MARFIGVRSGQRIVVFGELTNPSAASPTGPDVAAIIDATAGRVRQLPTRLHGTVTAIVPGQVNLDLRGIDRLGIGMFDFSGTGTSAMTDADPADYEVATATLTMDDLEVDRAARVIGFVNAFGAAPPDFSGDTLIPPRSLRSALGVGWGTEGTAAPYQSMGPASLLIDLTNPDIDERHHMRIGPLLIDLFDLPASPAIEPVTGRRLYGITGNGHAELFIDFTDFVDALALRLGSGDRARSMAAYGTYDDSMNSVAANRIFVHLQADR